MPAISRIALVSFSRHEFVRWKSSKFTSFSILRLFFNPPASTSPSRPWASVHSSLKSRSKRRLARSPPIHINPPILCPICGISCPVKCCELVTRCGNWMFSCLALLVWIDCKPKSILKGSCRPRCPVWCFPSFWCFSYRNFNIYGTCQIIEQVVWDAHCGDGKIQSCELS